MFCPKDEIAVLLALIFNSFCFPFLSVKCLEKICTHYINSSAFT